MRYKFLLFLLIVCFIALVGTCVYQGTAYPHPQYRYQPVPEDEWSYYLDRGLPGPVVKAIPISTPDNPTWVDIMRSGWFRIVLLVLFIFILHLLTRNYRSNRPEHTPGVWKG